MLVAQFHSWNMFINKENQEKFYQGYHPVFCIVHDVDTNIFRTASSTEWHFKFNPWKVVREDQIVVEEELFGEQSANACSRITSMIKDRIHMNYDKYGKIMSNYNREDL